ncbi:IucA/IucC family protein [Actinopolymorpha alba]|uniref:IucA/IucC family protein n=1 Tax=Actinopolymorpha alba TaxID=533267 RepID=UPI00036AD2B9|nr:IucA/IucC family protein [Actinopolymorpha alba]
MTVTTTTSAATGAASRPAADRRDPLDDPDPSRVADAAATENLLRCWIRETGMSRPDGDVLTVDLCSSGVRLEAEVRHWSLAGWHRFGEVWLGDAGVVDAATVAALLAREAAVRRDAPPHSGADLVARVLDSVRRVERHVADRRQHPDDAPATTPFLAGEQALLLGHPTHPAPKSRESLTDAEAAAFSPELRGSFPLHWFAADPAIVSADSAAAWQAADLVASLASESIDLPAGMVGVPAHPWQARDLVRRPEIAALVRSGLLRDLGPAGPSWFPTSSLRTVYRPDAPVMLKLSLGLRITNSRRENLRKELHRGTEITRLLDAGVEDALTEAHPGFELVRDPGWLAVDVPGERPDSGLDVVIRDNPFTAEDDVTCVAGLVAERPGLVAGSRLARVVRGLSERTRTPVAEVAAEWLRSYLRAVIDPVLWLYSHFGIALEAHQQNTLVVLDPDGWPVGGRYRDNQGFYYASSRLPELQRLLPNVGSVSDTTVPDEVVDERLGYYLGINNLLGLVGAFGSQGLADEEPLLALARDHLGGLSFAGGPVPGTLTTLVGSPTLRCKANLLTRLYGMDELVGPVSTQSVYVTIANPLLTGSP